MQFRINPPTHPHVGYRPDIDGLRAIAVLFVLLFHFHPSSLPGGFVGVDIFFVISGYLISKIIFKEISQDRFRLDRFYARRVNRIFPALVLMLLATAAGGWLFLFADELKSLGKHLSGGALFLSNFILWRETGYFADSAEHRPLLHLWSLAIEEQFYLLYPLAIVLAHRLRLSIGVFLTTLFVVSFCACLYGSHHHPSFTFYFPLTRLWELTMGGLLAHREHGRDSHGGGVSTIATVLSLLGLLLIAAGGALIHGNRVFPGLWALLPTVAASLIILAGNRSVLNRCVLGSPPLVFVGLISYPLYLWHWPVLYFARILSNGSPGLSTILLAAGLSFLLACITYFALERPLRRRGPKRIHLTILCLGMLLVLAIGVLAYRGILEPRLNLDPIGREAEAAKKDWPYPFSDNFKKTTGFQLDADLTEGSGATVLFVGDSHMQHYWPRIEMARTNLGKSARPVRILTAGGSPTLPRVNRMEAGYACDAFFEYAMSEAMKPDVGRVVLSCFWEHYFVGFYPSGPIASIYDSDSPDRIPVSPESAAFLEIFHRFGKAVRSLVDSGKEVFVILPSPAFENWNPRRIPSRGFANHQSRNASVERQTLEDYISPIKQILIAETTQNGGFIIDPFDFFEESGRFPGRGPDGKFHYRDAHHFRPFYVKQHARFIDSLLTD